MVLKKGDAAPDFSLESDEGVTVTSEDLKGKRTVLYFYPRDDTSGCTAEALEFTALFDEFEKTGASVIGVSPDSIKSHANFRQKHSLKIPLLSDPDNAVSKAYGAYGEKSMYGRKYMGVIRSTFVVSPEGTIEEAHYKVKPGGHAENILCGLKNEQN